MRHRAPSADSPKAKESTPPPTVAEVKAMTPRTMQKELIKQSERAQRQRDEQEREREKRRRKEEERRRKEEERELQELINKLVACKLTKYAMLVMTGGWSFKGYHYTNCLDRPRGPLAEFLVEYGGIAWKDPQRTAWTKNKSDLTSDAREGEGGSLGGGAYIRKKLGDHWIPNSDYSVQDVLNAHKPDVLEWADIELSWVHECKAQYRK
eukprot:gene11685-17054_t